MENFAIYCKTFNRDLKRFRRLLNSYNKFNKDGIKFYASVPEADFELFKGFCSDNVKIVTDESFAKQYMDPDPCQGYRNQEICKLTFFEAGYAENYLCVDSDAEFIRDFYKADFMANDKTPYIILVQDKDLSVEKYYRKFGDRRQKQIEYIYQMMGLDDRRFRTCHGMQVLNSRVLKSLKDDYMAKRGINYVDLIKESPFEYTWYNAWFQKCGLVPEMAVEPFFKTFHSRMEYVMARCRRLKLKDFSKKYVGIVLNGNWRRPVEKYKDPNFLHKIVYFVLKKVL